MEWVLLLGRILFGGFFVMGGAMHFMKLHDMTEYALMKGAPMPKMSTIVTGMVIMLAGLGIVFGVYQSIALLASEERRNGVNHHFLELTNNKLITNGDSHDFPNMGHHGESPVSRILSTLPSHSRHQLRVNPPF